MAIGSSLGITLPVQGTTAVWGSALNTELNKIITAVESQVPSSAIDFSSDFDLNGYSFTEVKAVAFEASASVTNLRSVYFNASGELVARDGANNEVQITASGVLNNASAGGLGDSGGDYGTAGITFDWDGSIYNAKNGAGADDYANVRMDELQLRDGSGNDLTVAAPAMATNYTLTLPDAVPSGATTILQADTGGDAVFSNTFSTDITFTGSAEVKHGDKTKTISNATGFGSDSTGGYRSHRATGGSYAGYWQATTGSDYFVYPINLRTGDSISSILITYYGNGSLSRDFRLESFFYSTSTITVHETANETATTEQTLVMTVSPEILIGSSTSHYYLVQDCAAGGDRAYHIQVTYNRP